MAFVLSRPASPLPREHRPQIPIDNQGLPHVNQTSPPLHQDLDMARDKDKPRLEILLDSPYIFLKGVAADVEPARLSGHLALYLTESTPIKEITLQFRGKARLPVSPSDSMALNTAPLTYIVCTHDWSFLEGDKKGHTLKAGRHLFPFQLRIGGSLPSSITSGAFGGASVAYKLRAHAVRSSFYQNLQATLPVPILRSFAPEALEYQQTLEIENTWPEKLMYSIMVPHKAWAAGDKVTALVKFSPLAKGASVISVSTAIHEQTKLYGRSGAQEHTRVAAIAKHDIVGSRAVEVETVRPGHSRGHSQSHSPGSPGSSSSGFTPAHRNMNATSAISRHFSRTSNSTHSRPSSPPLSSPLAQDPEPTTSLWEEASSTTESVEPENSDVVTYLSISIPLTVTPSHTLEPIVVSHRIRWSILILNLDGHTSELRCSLPLHILDYRLLAEARAFSAATRRLLLGSAEVPPAQEEEDVQLPSYKAHVRDRVANMFLPESATMRVTNPWISRGASPTFHPDSPGPITPWLQARSGHSTPLEAHLSSHLPHAPGSGSSTPLDWVNSELLLSLSDELPSSLSPNSHTPPTDHSPEYSSDPHSRRQSRRASRSRFSSRNTSLDRERSRVRERPTSMIDAMQIPISGPHETYVHNNNASRNLPELFQASMKPFSSFSPNHWIARAHHTQPPPSASDVHRMSQPHTVTIPAPDVHAGSALLHRAFTEVPDYAVASRGFIGGVPPLSSMRGLPSYEETQRTQSESDLAARFAQLGALVDHRVHEMVHSPLSTGSSP
ncbi:hypothetical protein BDZ94DRAFT_1249272 [Collybia nuda]|uniref:Arrestin C-terminal-like domain-containing protein n=1 Tax=Collybia nuda TaxID=64659 RepID=A0A9P5YDS0_9AGAR|nr:hypothetical protein BDZ94DRAFT_1249272 [Collybia nuda]